MKKPSEGFCPLVVSELGYFQREAELRLRSGLNQAAGLAACGVVVAFFCFVIVPVRFFSGPTVSP